MEIFIECSVIIIVAYKLQPIDKSSIISSILESIRSGNGENKLRLILMLRNDESLY